MRYESVKSPNGNIGVSYNSQEDADRQAYFMDNFNCTNCTNCINCNNCTNCNYCINCYDCNNCNYCQGCLRWKSHNVSNLLSLNGLTWPVSISETRMQIGCQNHSHADWANFTDSDIAAMENRALDFWILNKSMLINLCEMKSKLQ